MLTFTIYVIALYEINLEHIRLRFAAVTAAEPTFILVASYDL